MHAAELITSTANNRVRLLRSLADRKHRAEHGMFLAEGVRLAEEAAGAKIRPAILIYAPEQVGRHPRARAAVEALAPLSDVVLEATPTVVASVGDVQHGQGIAFGVPFSELHRPSPRQAPGQSAPLGLVLDAIADPGNMGTLLRTARAAGWAPILTPGAADPYAPKAVRAGAGAQFWLGPLHQQGDVALVGVCARFAQVLLADVDGEAPYDRVDWTRPSALIVAGETQGTRPEIRRLATGSVRIPMPGGGDSLNVAAAAAVICFEAVRQRSRAARPALPGRVASARARAPLSRAGR